MTVVSIGCYWPRGIGVVDRGGRDVRLQPAVRQFVDPGVRRAALGQLPHPAGLRRRHPPGLRRHRLPRHRRASPPCPNREPVRPPPPPNAPRPTPRVPPPTMRQRPPPPPP